MKIRCAMAAMAAMWSVGCADVGDVTTGAESVSASANLNPGIAPIGSRPHGHSYGEWEARWWQWSMQIPAARDPIADTTGAHCAEGQSGPVWFLAGTWGGTVRRECTIPTGTALYFPVVNQIWSQFRTDPPTTLAEMRDFVRARMRGATVSATIDGRPVVGVANYYEETAVFPATFGADNSWAVTATECPAQGSLFVCPESVDAGYALFVNPLTPGDHTLHFDATLNNGFSLDVTYTLHVR